ncbi:hypothetical protein GCK32_007654, partial [Trichostrongylus colubriformis]
PAAGSFLVEARWISPKIPDERFDIARERVWKSTDHR